MGKLTLTYNGEEFTIPSDLPDHLRTVLDCLWDKAIAEYVDLGKPPQHIGVSLVAIRDFLGLTSSKLFCIPKK